MTKGLAAFWCALWVTAAARAGASDSLEFDRFGPVALTRESEHPSNVVLFVSGDGGWNLGVVDMARALASLDALVVGIDIHRYRKALERSAEACSYFAADFEALSQFVQKKLAFPEYRAPVLVGYSSGAALVYATLVQAPPGTFRGALSLGFCPDLPLSRSPCRGHGLAFEAAPGGKDLRFLPAAELEAPWIAFQGTIDRVCEASRTRAYVRQVRGAEIVLLPKVGHGFSVQRNWLPQLQESFSRLATRAGPATRVEAPDVADLPLVEVPAPGGEGDTLAVVVSGDGGWASLDREVGQVLAARGIPVVGLDSLRYFWTRRTPEEASQALARILAHYLREWKRKKAILVGYSRGADVVPFLANRLPEDLLAQLRLIALLGPGLQVDFEFHLSDWLEDATRPTSRPVLPEVEKLRGRGILCVYGQQEPASLCPRLAPGLAVLDPRPGAHHFGGDYEAIARRILSEAGL